MTQRILVLTVIFAFIGSSGAFGGDCPRVCPGDCSVWRAFWRDVRDPVLGVTRVQCIEAKCPLTPWCFEVLTVLQLPFPPFNSVKYYVFGGLVDETTRDFTPDPGITAKVRDGVATVCVSGGYEWPIVLPGIGGAAGKAAVFRIPIGHLEGTACMGECFCTDFRWLPPFVWVSSIPMESPNNRWKEWKIDVRASDPNSDILCVWHKLITSVPPAPEITYTPEAELTHQPYFVGDCSYSFSLKLPCSTEPASAAVIAWAKDAKGLEGKRLHIIDVAGNRPPAASLPYLQGETTVTLTPTGVVRTPVVFQPINVWDPDGDLFTIKGYGTPPIYAENFGAFLGSLVALYTPGRLTEEDLCRAVRERDVYVDEFSLTLQDKCGAETEIPARVVIHVEDKVPPEIVYPARHLTVECNRQTNPAELSAWLGSHGGGPGRGQPPIPPLGRTTTTQTSSCAPAGALGALR
ncbi:MAG: hypothetical protein BIP78_1329 [Candidatus Bipolaricaulis sibiricus]|uniref:Uncharacterized protein n=1 Tax=Bipolaricaulis sibiricus TaxID=2501609 RepID=A0A410FVF7_BIPS1|nr:MAG: hypothetical protein BIP78_1329 [Candidatus Bipolaricaulis sibiricus]